MSVDGLLFAETHEWVRVEEQNGEKIATVGISAHAVEQLTDLTFMDLPDVGTTVTAGESFGEVESVKATSDMYSPVDGVIVAVNSALVDQLETLNTDPYDRGWIVKVRLTDDAALGRLMDYETYQKQCVEHGH